MIKIYQVYTQVNFKLYRVSLELTSANIANIEKYFLNTEFFFFCVGSLKLVIVQVLKFISHRTTEI